jgi:predicted RNase H-like HicB family nuclease
MSEPAATTNPPPGVEATPVTADPATPGPRLVTVEVMVRLLGVAMEEPGGGYSVVVPALPGCVTLGDTIEDVQANIVEASEGWLAVAHDDNRDQAVRDMLP